MDLDDTGLSENHKKALATAKHPLNTDYPVVVAIHPITGVSVQYALRENTDFPEWEKEMLRNGNKLIDTTIDEVVKDMDRAKAAGRPQKWRQPI